MGEALRDYRVRLQEKGVAVDPTWRGLGAAESNVDKFSNRLKKQGRAWRKEGLQAMMTVQAKHYEGTLFGYPAKAKAALNGLRRDAGVRADVAGTTASAAGVVGDKPPKGAVAAQG